MLTDKAKDDFWKWFLSDEILKKNKLHGMRKFNNVNRVIIYFLALPDICQEAIYIEWFESIGFHIGRYTVQEWWIENSTYMEQLAKSKDETFSNYDFIEKIKSQSEAIEKVNELYNKL